MITTCPAEEKQKVVDYLTERFGLSAHLFSTYGFYAGPGGKIFLGPQKIPHGVKPVSAGFLIARLDKAVKPTTNLFQLFGKAVKRNAVHLTTEQAVSYLRGEDLNLTSEQQRGTDGYVLVKYLDFPLGCSLLKESRLKNMLPKAKRMEVIFL